MRSKLGCLPLWLLHYGSLIVCCLLLSRPTHAGFATSFQTPFSMMAQIPTLQRASAHQESAIEVGSTLTTSNHWYLTHAKAEQHLLVDTESTTFAINARFYQDSLSFYIDIPYIRYGGGFLDDFINDYHGFWGLPNGDRHLYRQRQNRITYQKNQTLTPCSGFADGQLGITWLMSHQENSQHSVSTAIKPPTAQQDCLLSNGALAFSQLVTHKWQSSLWTVDLQYGAYWQERYDIFDWQSRPFIKFGTFAIGYNLYKQFDFTLQYDYHSALFRKGRPTPAGEGHMGSIGLIYNGNHHRFELAVQEDLLVGSTADVSFFLRILHRLD